MATESFTFDLQCFFNLSTQGAGSSNTLVEAHICNLSIINSPIIYKNAPTNKKNVNLPAQNKKPAPNVNRTFKTLA